MHRLDSSAFVRGLQATQAAILAVAHQSLGQTVAYAKELAVRTNSFQDRSGKLRGSIMRGERGPWSLFIRAGGSSAPHGLLIEVGTKAHEIRPKLGTGFVGPARASQGRSRGAAKPYLVFRIGGRWVRARVVKHPGTTARHFMLDARDQAEVQLGRFIEIGLSQAIH